ncbi:ESCRT-II complex vps25 subunit [Stereum hirsutum FP-91666 SS1]|uniref:ESCRT-II complex vps25 subunit n=1 Tax=Stereum hirsutum (strain FP-91666) TaxID=721885 RepID=UPI000440AD74|nr:ESCRT-II complex vps25 subunit [Stereum hirsutum FP-91666 SS1]EIM90833.1 ESCRT-II complex vps25 subunit [Stereum hirsutum FP-91666 SS1]
MSLAPHTTSSGTAIPHCFVLPSIHSAPPFFTQQPNETTQAVVTDNWTRLILAYARYRKLFVLRVEDAETTGGDWDEVLRNERINRRLLPSHLSFIIASMVTKNLAAYEPPKQTRSVILHWRLPEEWAEVLHEWASASGHLNTILTFYEITDPPVESPLSGLPTPLLRKAIAILSKSGRAQIISISDGEGVRFFSGGGK